jgi:hypothetical protein
MAWLVTGGAGYIGSHVVRAFLAEGIDVVVLDDLSSGHADFVPAGVPFVQGTLLDTALLAKTFAEHPISGVVHVAGFKYAGVSVSRPLHTYEQNVTATALLLAAMQEAGVGRIVFSSSAAVYGTPFTDLVTEETAKSPESPYGESKLIGEWLLRDQAVAAGLAHTSLRYFNVVGSGSPELRDTSPHNLFPMVFEALIEGRTPRINGNDYNTEDGTCVRGPSAGCRPGDRPRLQPRQRRRRLGRSDHEHCRLGHRHRLHTGDRPAPHRRPRPDRGVGRDGRARSGLEDASQPRGHGAKRLGVTPGLSELTRRDTIRATGRVANPPARIEGLRSAT